MLGIPCSAGKETVSLEHVLSGWDSGRLKPKRSTSGGGWGYYPAIWAAADIVHP